MDETSPMLLLTRPTVAAERFLAQVEAAAGRKVEAVLSPLIVIEPLQPDLPDVPFAGLVATSENGVDAAVRLGLSRQLPVWCVGNRTAAVARAAGFAAISADGDANALVDLILSRNVSGPLLHLRGEHARGDVAGRLSAASVACVAVVAYRQHALELTASARALLRGMRPVVLPLFSPRTVSVLAQQGPFSAPLRVVAISAAAAVSAQEMAPTEIITAASPDAPSMVEATIRALGPSKPAGGP